MRRTNVSRGALLLELALAPPLALILVYLALAAAAGTTGLRAVADDQVAVRVDAWSGRARVVDSPGYLVCVPWLQEVHLLDKRPQALVLREGEVEDPATRPRLLVRAVDGSSFWFKTYTIQYALRPQDADRVLVDSGPGDGYKEFLVNTFARSVLRDEFGRYGADQIVDPVNLGAATRRSHEELDRLLAPHGLRVVELSAPNPAFDLEYEQAIERRKVHNQQAAFLRQRQAELQAERGRRLAAARKEGELAAEALAARLRLELLGAREELIRARGEAGEAHAKRVAAGRAARTKRLAEADAQRARTGAEVEGLRLEIAALAAGGEALVRRELIERLASVPFKLVPYARERARAGEAAEGTR